MKKLLLFLSLITLICSGNVMAYTVTFSNVRKGDSVMFDSIYRTADASKTVRFTDVAAGTHTFKVWGNVAGYNVIFPRGVNVGNSGLYQSIEITGDTYIQVTYWAPAPDTVTFYAEEGTYISMNGEPKRVGYGSDSVSWQVFPDPDDDYNITYVFRVLPPDGYVVDRVICRSNGTVEPTGEPYEYTASGQDDQYIYIYMHNTRNLKSYLDEKSIEVKNCVVTASFDDCVYVESKDRTWGIKVVGADVSTGMITVNGKIKTDDNGERYIEADSYTLTDSATTVKPFYIPCSKLGGGDYFYSSYSTRGQRGVTGGSGLNNVGMLVRTMGKVTAVAADCISIADGVTGTSVKITDFASLPQLSLKQRDYVSVTGVVSLRKDSDNYFVNLRAKSIELLK